MKKRFYRFWEQGYLYFLIALVIYGIFLFSPNLGIYDWCKEIPYFQYIKISFTVCHSWPLYLWQVPLYITRYPAIIQSRNFIANPETWLFSPFTYLLFVLPEVVYVKILALFHFILGAAGVVILKKRLDWNSNQFRIFAALFLLSPIIIQHLAIGFTPWLNLFFFPWIIYFLADKRVLVSSLGLAAILALILLQGGMHIFIWMALFFIFYSVFSFILKKNVLHLGRLALVFLMVPLLTLVRIVTTIRAYGNFDHQFSYGYNFINFVFFALIPPIFNSPFYLINNMLLKSFLGMEAYDAGIFWGFALAIFVVLLIKYKSICQKSARQSRPEVLNYTAVLFTAVIFFCLSFFRLYEKIGQLSGLFRWSLVSADKYPYRLAIPAFLAFSLVAAQFIEHIWQTMGGWFARPMARRFLLFFLNGLFYLSLIFFVFSCLALAVSFLYEKPLVSKLINYSHNTLVRQVLFIRENWSQGRLTGILLKRFGEIRLLLMFVAGLSVLVWLTTKFKKILKKVDFFVWLELLTVLPLLWASFMWLSVATSRPAEQYFYGRFFPTNSASAYRTGPWGLVLYQNLAEKNNEGEYLFRRLPAADQKFLKIISGNAEFIQKDSQFLILPHNTKPIMLVFRSETYRPFLIITAISWSVLLVGVLLLRILNKHNP